MKHKSRSENIRKISMVEIKRALLDPSSVFKSPGEVIKDKDLTRDQKIEILRRWEYDAIELQVAEEENMQGQNGKILDEILNALREIKADYETQHPT
ncbi:MAG: hypothetical protein ACR2NW_09220, partial [Thermodesulfobacteriota bacterium]